MPRVQVDKIDPEEADFPPRRRTRAPASVRDRQAEAAYEFVRLFVDLESPTAPVDQPGFGSPYHAPWAVRRAFLRLASEGVLRVGELPKRDARGRMVWHSFTPGRGSKAGNSVVWAEGAWRLTYFSMSPRAVMLRANKPRRVARHNNRSATASGQSTHGARKRGRIKVLETPGPSSSMRSRISQFFRGIESVDWDGTAYIPVPGPALEAVRAWRASLIANQEDEPVAPARPPAKEHDDGMKTCRKCGALFSPALRRNHRSHSLKECMVWLAAKVMEE